MSDENKPASWWSNATEKATSGPPADSARQPRPLYDPDYRATAKTHEQLVQSRLGWIMLFTGIVAAATVANFIAGVIIGAAATL